MTEKDIIFNAKDKLEMLYPKCAVWKAPSFKTMSWDIFGLFDLCVATPDGQIIFIQCTTTPNLSARRKKIQSFFTAKNFTIPNSYIWAWDNAKYKFVIEKV